LRRYPDGRLEHPDAPATPDRRNRHRPHLPERRAVSQSLGSRQCPRRHPRPHLERHHLGLAEARLGSPQRGRRQQEGARDPGLSGEQGPMTAMLNVKDLRAYYGQVQALHGLSFALNEGSLTTLLGANGAGKTTTLRAICNMVRSTGAIEFEGKPLSGKSTENVVRLGIA